MVFSLLCAAINVAFALYIPLLFGGAVDLLIGEGRTDLSAVGETLTKSIVCILICAVGAWLSAAVNNRITFGVVRDIRNKTFEKINILPLSYLDMHKTGDTLSRIVNDTDTFADGLLLGFTQFFSGVLTIAGTLILLIRLNVLIAAAVVLLTPLSLFASRFLATRSYRFFREQATVRGEQTAVIDEVAGNLKTVKAFSREETEQRRFEEINGRLQKASLRAVFCSSAVNPTTRFVNSLVYAAVALLGAFSVTGLIGGGLTVGLLAAALSYANQYTRPFNEISSVFAELQNALGCADRVFTLMEAQEETPDKNDALVFSGPPETVEAENVSFSYDPASKLIENFNLHVKKGSRVAIVGPTGCGKTTIINLLMRFYDVDAGAIRLDGTDIRDVTRRSLRGSYGMVLQETWLQNASVRDNIRLGKPDATDDEIVAAAKKAHAHSFIKRLPQGYDTVLGEDGGSLSQGQKQLLCITRVMLCAPPMLILDEATSSIDLRTEIKVQKAFNTLMEGCTSFVVAHRLSTIMHADLILVMDRGSVVEQGTHSELLANRGFYYRLWNSQFE
ncbi:MAG: ABC transporter ATP-binding protein [Clostridia bacterium]|nr:ABC transporter ATP-binding protein [Clostridia bacterium]